MGTDKDLLQTAMQIFNREHRCSFTLGEEIGYGISGDVYTLSGHGPGNSLFSWGRKKTTQNLFDDYRDYGYVMKVMRTDTIIDEHGKHKVNSSKQKENQARYSNEVLFMTKLASSGYTMPLLASSCISFEQTDIYLLCMPKLMTLDSYRSEHWNESLLLQLGKDIARALAYCHQHGIEQRDVKWSNIYARLMPDGTVRFILGDFGFARNYSEAPLYPGIKFTQVANENTPWELVNGDSERYIHFTADIAEWGYMLWERFQLVLHATDSQDRPIDITNPHKLSEWNPDFLKIILRAIHDDPAQRYENGGALLNALEQICLRQPPRRGTRVISSPNYALAVNAIGRKDYNQADIHIITGITRQEAGCTFLKYYLQARDMLAHAQSLNQDQIKDLYFSVEESMDDISHRMERAALKCLLALLAGAVGDEKQSQRVMHDAAQDGFIPAQYYYGRMLLVHANTDSQLKRADDYVRIAAEWGYYEAVSFLKDYSQALQNSMRITTKIDEMDYMTACGQRDLWAHRHGATAFVRLP